MSADSGIAYQECQQRATEFNAQRRAESNAGLTPAEYARARGMQNAFGNLTLQVDSVAEMLDELADLAEVWRRRRMAGQETGSTRVALLNAAAVVTALHGMERKA